MRGPGVLVHVNIGVDSWIVAVYRHQVGAYDRLRIQVSRADFACNLNGRKPGDGMVVHASTESLGSLRVERSQPPRFLLELLSGLARQAFERLELHSPARVSPCSRHSAINEERGYRVRRLGIEDHRAVWLRKDACTPGVHEESRIAGRQKADRCRRVRAWQGSAGNIEQPGAALVTKEAKRQTLHCLEKAVGGNPSPACDIAHWRRTEPTEIAPDEMLQPFSLRCARGTDPFVSEAVEVGPPLRRAPRA